MLAYFGRDMLNAVPRLPSQRGISQLPAHFLIAGQATTCVRRFGGSSELALTGNNAVFIVLAFHIIARTSAHAT